MTYQWDNKKPTAQMLGRWQPFHDGHFALFEETIKKTGQVCFLIRDVQGVDDNPFDFETVKKSIEARLNPKYEGRFKIMLVPNITNICYGRGVGYKIEEIIMPEKIQKISATKIRAKMRDEGKLKQNQMNDRLKTIVDLEKYPIQDLNSPQIKEIIKKCKSDLDQFSCSTIPNFILPKSLKIMNIELEKQVDEVYMSNESINPYLHSKDEPSLEKDHPKRIFSKRYNGYLNSDLFDKDSEMKFLYEQEELLNFVSACVGISPIYRWADPLACHAYNVMKPNGILPWHFDSCEFTLSIMIQKPEKGGIFEYCPYIREPGNENFEEVKKVLDGDRKRVRQLKLEQGDLQIFKGRFTLHRVTKIEGNRSRYLCIPAYVLDPWRVNTPEHSRTIYGKVLPIHIERNKERADGLAD